MRKHLKHPCLLQPVKDDYTASRYMEDKHGVCVDSPQTYGGTTFVFLQLQSPDLPPAKNSYKVNPKIGSNRSKMCGWGWFIYLRRILCGVEEEINTTNTKSSQIVKSAPPLATNKPAYITCAKAGQACIKMRTVGIHGYCLMFISGYVVKEVQL